MESEKANNQLNTSEKIVTTKDSKTDINNKITNDNKLSSKKKLP